ncbi:hypothetical protein NDU88_001482 [Pleurodeles waltl]|uniref:Uncharacterized protein n=1 Tax=Pleurodeles waltl TaxID=8319 RepID=A0AAV7USV8_PLEWA|nr:hypothetical protein NDU88_001482 [Pleurodeles waltl]
MKLISTEYSMAKEALDRSPSLTCLVSVPSNIQASASVAIIFKTKADVPAWHRIFYPSPGRFVSYLNVVYEEVTLDIQESAGGRAPGPDGVLIDVIKNNTDILASVIGN